MGRNLGPMLAASIFSIIMPSPVGAAEWTAEANPAGFKPGCYMRTTQGSTTLRLGITTTGPIPLQYLSIQNPAWHFSDSNEFQQRTLLRYSDGDTVKLDADYEPEYDGDYVSTMLQPMQLSTLAQLKESQDIAVVEYILDVPGADDVRFDLTGLYDKLPELEDCLPNTKKSSEKAREKILREMDEGLKEAVATNKNPASSKACPTGFHGTPPNCIEAQEHKTIPGLPGINMPD